MNPNSVKSALRFALGALSLGILTACGGSGGQELADGGIRGTGSSVGPVSGFGSVFVNGIEFETDGNVVSDDGITSEAELQKGMILRIEGEWREDGTGNALVVEYDDTFRGQITNFDGLDLEGAGNFEILGQTITISPQTVIRPAADEPNLSNDDFVRVSAWRDGSVYRASLVEVIADSPEVEIEGPASPAPAGASTSTFSINGQLITYSDTTFQDDSELTEPELEDLISGGQFVEVEGSLDINGEISANKVSLADDRRFQGTNGEDIEITGPVNDFTGGDTFSINGIPVDILEDTRFDDLVSTDLVDGLLVEVEGDVIDGVVQAEEISLRESNAEVKGDINSPDPGAQTFSVGGVLVRVTSQTLITDDEDTIITREVDFNKLTAGTNVEVEGLESRDEQNAAFIEALKIEFEDDGDNEFELEGKLQSVSETATLIGTNIRVLDVTIDLTVDTEFENDRPTLQKLEEHVGQLIEVEYVCASGPGQGCTARSIDLD